MKIQVIFENSGDTITFDAINSEVVEYYIENLNNLNSNKFLATHPDKLEKSLKKLKDSIHSVNEFAVDLIGIEFPNLTDEQYLDQRVLNDLHCQWVKSQSILFDVKQLRNSNNIKTAEYAEAIFHQSDDDGMLPSFDLVLKKLNLSDPYSQINLLLHAV